MITTGTVGRMGVSYTRHTSDIMYMCMGASFGGRKNKKSLSGTLYDVCQKGYSMTYVTKYSLLRMSRRTLYDVCQEGLSMTYVKKDTLWRMSRRTLYDVCQEGLTMTYVKKDTLWCMSRRTFYAMTYVNLDSVWRMSRRTLYDLCQQGHSMTYVNKDTPWRMSRTSPYERHSMTYFTGHTSFKGLVRWAHVTYEMQHYTNWLVFLEY